ncbi:hypothetical protein KBD08_03615 [Candidatus Babeliales bacterium]|nr:hypothetical protein [Candidatus Babeliales bacterium]
MKLKIITTKKITHYDVDWVELNTPVGNMIVQENHVPMVVELAAGKEFLYQVTGGTIESFAVLQGVAHVARTEVKILLPVDL